MKVKMKSIARFNFVLFQLFFILLFVCSVNAEQLTENDITYLGAFALPFPANVSTYNYGMRGMGFYNDPTYGPSLFIRGHDNYDGKNWTDGWVGQVDVPATLGTGSWSSLPEASEIQNITNITDGKGDPLSGTSENWDIYGMLAYNGRLIYGATLDYGQTWQQTATHGASSFDLSNKNDFTGWERVGDSGATRYMGGYMGHIPSDKQSLFGGVDAVTGSVADSIVGATSAGPALALFDPDDIGNSPPPHSATQLLYYSTDAGTALSSNCPTTGACEDPLFNALSTVNGIAIPSGYDTAIFIGNHDIADGDGWCYGTTAECTSYFGNSLCTPDSKGEHSDSVKNVIWAYDIQDLADVYNRTAKPHEPTPELWTSVVSNAIGTGGSCDPRINSATYDDSTRRLYVAVGYTSPTIHVFEIASADGMTTCYLDADGDGYSNGTTKSVESTCSTNYYTAAQLTATSGDCNDSNASIKPGATDTCGNGIDEDCNGSDSTCSTGNRTVKVSTLSELYGAFSSEQDGDDIIISPGTYTLNTMALSVDANNITVRSSTGRREDVIIQGDSMSPNSTVKSIFYFPRGKYGQNTTIKNLSIGRVGWHAVFFNGDGSGNGTTIDNVRIFDCYEQFIKGTVVTSGTNNVTVKNSLLEFTSPAKYYYTGGIDTHHSDGWLVQGNEFRNIQSPSVSVAEHAIHFWSNTSFSGSNTIERNKIINCDRGIGIWNGTGTNVIRNNMITSDGSGGFADVGIDIQETPNARVYNNTVWIDPAGYKSSIEFRGAATTNSYIVNNLTNKQINIFNGASGATSNNVTNAQSSWFVNTSAGDLHLGSAINGVTDSGISVTGLTNDFDGETRSGKIDIGADEKQTTSTILPPQNLRIQ